MPWYFDQQSSLTVIALGGPYLQANVIRIHRVCQTQTVRSTDKRKEETLHRVSLVIDVASQC